MTATAEATAPGAFTRTEHLDGKVTLYGGDNRDVLKSLPDCSIDSIVTDPPYALVSIVKRFGGEGAAAVKVPESGTGAYARASSGFMGKKWDTGEVAFSEVFWAECLRVLKPGGHVVAFSGTRTYHRMAVAIEDAGFEIRDQIGYLYGSGFPKSHNVSRKLDGQRCTCAGCEAAEQVLQHDMRQMRDADVSAAEHTGKERGEILQPGVSECGTSTKGREQFSATEVRDGQPRMEGRRNTKAPKGKLRLSEIREMPAPFAADVEAGRLRDGASQGDGRVGGPTSDANGGGSSCGPQAAEQPANELGVMAGQPQPQDGGAWPNCRRCGKPIIPDGIGTALKPAWEPICLARKPLTGTVAANVLEHGTGALNIDGCRVGNEELPEQRAGQAKLGTFERHDMVTTPARTGRWPANIVHDGSDEVLAGFPSSNGAGEARSATPTPGSVWGIGAERSSVPGGATYADSGSAARFFYTAKADKLDRIGSKHPTVKPVDLMQWLCRLVTPPGGIVLDPFAGSGSTGEAAWREGMRCVLIEREEEYQADIAERLRLADKGPRERRAKAIKQDNSPLGLFSQAAA